MIESSFDLFGEISNEEQQKLEERKKIFESNFNEKILRLPQDPSKRSMTENRMIFCHKKEAFQTPGTATKVLSASECNKILEICKQQESWTKARHSAFATTDIPIRSNGQLDYLEPLMKSRLFDRLATHYGFKPSDLGFRDIFLVKYSAEEQRGLGLHADGCLFSITLLISHPDDFEGGGTYFASIDQVVHLGQGDCAYHDARVMHSGMEITKGERYVLVGFIDTADTIEKDQNNTARRL
ncbi:hypothetical protein G6F46_004633 [Rhizopus delemar]|uniref:Fe2OG dioxygenase domain-containing protein n=3 Tax=Rhizopus TaxID=4842 RepID=I1CL96_RHIO9|nr:hypothetical protein RO3G_13937 [Rhizopus delemar RA 99-880]KAG1460389.1 hypothetical protein G6F55_004194 [Rhizopus delemar]KAG1546500.1 hypothetical protein G6F51_004836 [Rhizopus arrhizus]KAG1500017.1 hypothetical protein G6F54_004008 [Rhizopus delemar]KAG1513749.1 hypothetical protein G6F53_004198 [Rhizopus delemar]|eukprot:EIE89226.1 hypothetical protein RO3G_13937 [Rhizopus delemar RA 99-880]